MLPQSKFGKFSKMSLAAATGVIAAAVSATPALAAAAAPDSDGPYKGRVTSKSGLLIRTAPTAHSKVVGSVPHGATVKIACKVRGEAVGGNARWYRLRDGRYVEGFSAARFIANIGAGPQWCSGPAPYKGKVVSHAGVNVRTGPGNGHRIVGMIPNGAVVHIMCKVRGQAVGGNARWYKLRDGRYVEGFSAARYIANIGATPKWC